MRAVLVERPGGLDALRLVEVPDPVPAAGEALIDVAFAGCNWSDVHKRQGSYPDPISYPAVIGLETLEDLEAVAQNTLTSGAGIGGDNVGTEARNDEILDDTGTDDLGGDDVYSDAGGESDSPDFEPQDSESGDGDDREAESADVVPLRAAPADTERSE